MTPNFELGRDFLYNSPTPKFHHPMCTGSEVIMLTNKQTNKQTPLDGWQLLHMRFELAHSCSMEAIGSQGLVQSPPKGTSADLWREWDSLVTGFFQQKAFTPWVSRLEIFNSRLFHGSEV